MSSTFDTLVSELTRDAHRVQPKDALQFCANWFQSRLEEQRTRTRDVLSQRATDLPAEFYIDAPLRTSTSPFGTLNVPGNALLSENPTPPTLTIDGPTSPLTINPFTNNPGDYLHPPTSAIFARRTSVSAESIMVDTLPDEPLPVYRKTSDQLRRIKASIANNFIFRDLDEEQETGVLNAMREQTTMKDEVVIRQGDVGEYFYVVESGLLHCYIRPEPLPPAWLNENHSTTVGDKFVQPGYHPDFGKKVAECKPGNSFGELALMYGHPRAATVLSIEPSTLWALDRITFRTIILKAAHRRRTMYEQFLSTVTLLSSLDAAERSKIADALVSKVYMDGDAVVRQGEMGDTFFFVEEGEAIVTKSQQGDDGEIREINVGHLRKGDYFGGMIVLYFLHYSQTLSQNCPYCGLPHVQLL